MFRELKGIFQIDSPQYLWLLVFAPLVILFIAWSFRAKKRALESFAAKAVLSHLIPNAKSRLGLKAFLIILALILIIFSLSKPRWGKTIVEMKRRGIDIVIDLDISRSMLAEDVSPTRLDKAKRKIENLLNRLQGDRIGLVIFSSTAFVQCPLTSDYTAYRLFLNDVSPNSISAGGTAIGSAIKKSIESFEDTERRYKAVILITDGEDHDSDPLKAAELAREKGIKIFTIGIGTKEGIYTIKEDGKSSRLMDKDGQVVKTRLDEDLLTKIATETDGAYVPAVAGDFDLNEIYDKRIAHMEKKDVKSQKASRFEHKYQIPLLFAVILLILETLIPDVKTPLNIKAFGRLLRGKKTAVTLMIFMLLPSAAYCDSIKSKVNRANKAFTKEDYTSALKDYLDAQVDKPEAPELYFNIGDIHYREKDYDKAMDSYRHALSTTDPQFEAKIRYNMGNCMFKAGAEKESIPHLQQAIDHYREVLKINKDHEDAKFNIEVAKAKIKEIIDKKKKEQENKKQDQAGKNNEEKKQDQKEQQGKQEQKEDNAKEDSGQQGEKMQQLSKEQAENILRSMEEDEKEKRKERVFNVPNGDYNIDKDW